MTEDRPSVSLPRGDPNWAISELDVAGVGACSLAKNHVLDFGETAPLDTIEALDEAAIACVGAGRTHDEALHPAFVEICGLTVVAFTDNAPEYAVSEDSAGTA